MTSVAGRDRSRATGGLGCPNGPRGGASPAECRCRCRYHALPFFLFLGVGFGGFGIRCTGGQEHAGVHAAVVPGSGASPFVRWTPNSTRQHGRGFRAMQLQAGLEGRYAYACVPSKAQDTARGPWAAEAIWKLHKHAHSNTKKIAQPARAPCRASLPELPNRRPSSGAAHA